MDIVNLVESLASLPYLIFAAVIGIIVSFDVMVVELTRDYESELIDGRRSRWTSRMRSMTLWHAVMHSASFAIYLLVIWAAQFIPLFAIDLFDVPDGVGSAFLIIINFLIVCFVWWTYRSKITEDHSEKSNDGDVVDRQDMRFFVDFVRVLSHRFGFAEKARGVAVAGSVAVDMLAISALLKIYLLPGQSAEAYSTLTGWVLVDIPIFAAVIFLVVSVCVISAQAAGQMFRESTKAIATTLRLAEPLAVFFIMAGAMRSAIQFYVGEYAGYATDYGYLFDLGFAVVATYSLFLSNALSWDDAMELFSKRSNDAATTNPEITSDDLTNDLRRLMPVLWVFLAAAVCVFLSLWLAYSTNPGADTHNHLIEATGYLAGFILLGTIAFLYLPVVWLDNLETSENANFARIHKGSPVEFWSRLAGVVLALAAVVSFQWVVAGRSFAGDAIAMWSLYIVLTWALFDLRRWRFFKSSGGTTLGPRTNDADLAEVVSALGVSSAVVALSVPFFVAQFIS